MLYDNLIDYFWVRKSSQLGCWPFAGRKSQQVKRRLLEEHCMFDCTRHCWLGTFQRAAHDAVDLVLVHRCWRDTNNTTFRACWTPAKTRLTGLYFDRWRWDKLDKLKSTKTKQYFWRSFWNWIRSNLASCVCQTTSSVRTFLTADTLKNRESTQEV